VADEPGWSATPNNFEGVHVTVDAAHGNGWALLRKSLHDPVLPLNIESEEIGGVLKIAGRMQAFLSQFDELDVPQMN
jgi:phosphomannomutase